jgi:O-antigen ligase
VPGLVGTLIALFTNIAIDPSTGSRTRAIDRAGQEIAQHLWLGRGMGTYLPTKYGYLDNQYLGTIVMAGIVGLAALIFLFLAAGYAAMRARVTSTDPETRELGLTLAACLTIPAISAATFDLLAFSVASGFAFLLMGCSGALLRVVKDENAKRPERVRP